MRLKNGDVLLRWPLAQHIITAGWTYNDDKPHSALDFRAAIWTPVFAAESGTVNLVHKWNGKVTKDDTNSYGNCVKIRHADYNGGALETLYAHLHTIDVIHGQPVAEGQIIGYSGETGFCRGAHLHYEVRYKGKRVNPLYWHDGHFSCADDDVANHLGTYVSVKPDSTYFIMDVSKFQGTIDWSNVHGIDGVIIRAGYGMYPHQTDPMFEANYAGAKAAGLPVGAYWYSYAQNPDEGRREAAVFLDAIKGKEFELPLYFDQEDKAITLMRTDTAIAFLDALGSRYKGYYSYTNWMATVDMAAIKKHCDTVWQADYRANANVTEDLHQYTSNYQMDGIAGRVDMSKGNVDLVAKGKHDTPTVQLFNISIGPMTKGDLADFEALASRKEIEYEVTA